jgi:hypothetical protein
MLPIAKTLDQLARLGKRLFESLYKGGKTD